MSSKASIRRHGAVMALIVFAAGTVSSQVEARGAAPTLTAPGVCTVGASATVDASTTVQAVLVKSQNIWTFGLTVVGPNSVGDWKLVATKNGVLTTNPQSPLMVIPPPGGWTAFVASTTRTDKGLVTFTGEATSLAGERCTANIAIKP